MSAASPAPPDAAVARFLKRSGLVPDPASARLTPLTGGVASDILKVEAPGRVFALKRALAKLRVEQDWQVPTSRNAQEVAWLRVANHIVPGSAPAVLAHDPAAGMFAMTYLDPADHPVWKTELRAGSTDPAFAAAVGRTLAAIHAGTAGDPDIAGRFANQALFHAIRLDPYLLATARRHPDLAPRLRHLAGAVGAARIALMHGDVSPKNILCGPGPRPVLLDAECACYGDPAFDAAFCLNHLLLKCVWVPSAAAGFLACFEALAAAWLGGAAWEDRTALDARAAALLPALMLARVDGKSPVEYITADADKAHVRAFARAALAAPPTGLAQLREQWRRALPQRVGML